MFKAGYIYRHSNTDASCDMWVHRVQYRDHKRCKLVFTFLTKTTGIPVGIASDKCTIKAEDYKNWTLLKRFSYD